TVSSGSTSRSQARAHCCCPPGRRGSWYTSAAVSGRQPRVVAELRERCTLLSGPVCEGSERGRSVGWINPDVTAGVRGRGLLQGRLRDPVLRSVDAAGHYM